MATPSAPDSSSCRDPSSPSSHGYPLPLERSSPVAGTTGSSPATSMKTVSLQGSRRQVIHQAKQTGRLIDYFAVCGLGMDKGRMPERGDYYCLTPQDETGCVLRVRAPESPRDFTDSTSDTCSSTWLPWTPSVVDRAPAADHPDFCLPQALAAVVLHQGVRLYSQGTTPDVPDSLPRIFPAVFRAERGQRVYVAALRFRDRLDASLSRFHGFRGQWYADKCICLVSQFPFWDTFLPILQDLHHLCFSGGGNSAAVWDLVNSLLQAPLPPNPSTSLLLSAQNRVYPIALPSSFHTRPPEASFAPLVECLGIDSIIDVFTGLLQGGRLLLLSRSAALLTVAAEALAALLYPFKWTSHYAPLLPLEDLDGLDASAPYICGVCRDGIALDLKSLDRVLVADLDRSELRKEDGGACSGRALPPACYRRLRKTLSVLVRPRSSSLMAVRHARDREEAMLEDMHLELADKRWGPRHDETFHLAFIRCLATLFSGYRNFLAPRLVTAEHLGYQESSDDSPRIFSSLSVDPELAFRSGRFFESKGEQLGEGAVELLRAIMATPSWSLFLSEQLNLVGPSFFDDVVRSLSTGHELLVRFPVCKPQAKSAYMIPQKGPGRKPQQDEVSGGNVCFEFPVSKASVVHQARAILAAQSLCSMEVIDIDKGAPAQVTLLPKLLSRLECLASVPEEAGGVLQLCHVLGYRSGGFDCYEGGASSDGSSDEGSSSSSREDSDDEGAELSCVEFSGCSPPEENFELRREDYAACSRLVMKHVMAACEREDYSCAALWVEIAAKLHRRSSAAKGARISMVSDLKQLHVWSRAGLWEAVLQRRENEWLEEEGDLPGLRGLVLKSMLGIIAEAGLSCHDFSFVLDEVYPESSSEERFLLETQLASLCHPPESLG